MSSGGRSLLVPLALAVAAALASAGCRTQTQNGALIGGLGGAGLGAIIGNQFGVRNAGALLGGLGGAAAGAAVGSQQDAERFRHEVYSPVVYVPKTVVVEERRAVTDYEVIEMTRAGLSEPTIVAAIRANGGRFQTSPEALITLREQGVGDDVIQEMLRHPAR